MLVVLVVRYCGVVVVVVVLMIFVRVAFVIVVGVLLISECC